MKLLKLLERKKHYHFIHCKKCNCVISVHQCRVADSGKPSMGLCKSCVNALMKKSVVK